jgi:hypothetical protein
VASVYKPVNRNEISYDYEAKDKYDDYKKPGNIAIEGLQFKGLEEILDIKKFSEILRHIGKKSF